jgi:hypothetical protein
MSTPSFSEQVDALNRQLREIEDRVGRGGRQRPAEPSFTESSVYASVHVGV